MDDKLKLYFTVLQNSVIEYLPRLPPLESFHWFQHMLMTDDIACVT